MTSKDEADSLRSAAEVYLRTAPATQSAAAEAADADPRRLVHELQVREIELEMQNNELRESRAELEASLVRYTELYDFAPVGYLTLSFDGLIAEINLTCATLLGVERGNLLNKRFNSFVRAQDQDRWARFFSSVRSHAEQEDVELVLQRGDGAEFFAQLGCVRHTAERGGAVKVGAGDTAPNHAGNTLQVSIALTDITARKGVEAKLHEALAAAEKANRAKSDFLSSMSHELRTPLNAILGFAQLMETSTPPPSPSQQRDLARILAAGWFLLELINEILDLSLIESGKALLTREPVALDQVMLECRAMIEPQAQQRNIGLIFPPSGNSRFISADPVRVKQVLINLLFNAIKYNKPGGTVCVEYSPSPPNSIRISVRDTGHGMTAQQLSQLFQPFNRLGKEAGEEEGTGIGLVVTKRLVELMGGAIGVDSSVGTGSVFWVEFELTTASASASALRAAEHAAPAPPRMATDTSVRTLLCVEDNSANLELVEELVARRADLRLISAADGLLGIEFARAYQPWVILMDINLPGLSGLDAMRILREDPLTAHIPVVALSANAMLHDIDEGLRAGFLGYLTKPIRVKEFMATLDMALEFAERARAGKK